MPNDITGYLQSLPADDNTRADAWDAFNGAKDQNDFQQKVGKLNIPDSAKADLWDAKYSNKALDKFQGPTPKPQPQATNPSQPEQGPLSKLWGWANEPMNLGHIRSNIAQAEAASNEPITDEEYKNHLLGTQAKHFVEGFSADAAKMLMTPLSAGLAVAGPIAEGTGRAALAAKAALAGVGGYFGYKGGEDLAEHGATPNETEHGYTDPNYIKRVGQDTAMILGGAAGLGKEGAALPENLRTAQAKVPTPPGGPATPEAMAGAARTAQAVGATKAPNVSRTVHVDPKMADAINQFNQADLPGKRVIIKTSKGGNQTLKLANTDPNSPGLKYHDLPNTVDTSVSDTPDEAKIPVELSTQSADGKRGTSTAGHYLDARVVGETPIAAPETALPATETISPTPSTPEVSATPPRASGELESPDAQKPTEQVVDSTPLPQPQEVPQTVPSTPQEVEKTVVQADPSRGIQEIKLPTIQGEPSTPNVLPTTAEPVRGVSPGLPSDIAGSKPRYGYKGNNFELQFQDPKDLAAYTVTQAVKNKAHGRFLDYLQSQGMDPDEALDHGRNVRQAIKEQAAVGKPSDGPLVIPPIDRATPLEDSGLTKMLGVDKDKKQPQAKTPLVNPADLVAHENSMRPLIGETMRLGQLRLGEQASHAIDIAMRESRDSAGKIPKDVADKVSKLINQPVGDRLTPAQMSLAEQRRGGQVSEEPKISFMSQSEADRRSSDPISGDEFQKQMERSQDDLLSDLADENISPERKAKLAAALEPDSKGRFRPFTYEHGLEYPRPFDLPTEHPEATFAPKALGHDVSPINLKNLEAAIGKQPRDLFMSTSQSNPYVSDADLTRLKELQTGTEPGTIPSSDQLKDLIGTAEDDKPISVRQSDEQIHAGSEAAEFKRSLIQKALDNRQAKTVAVLKGKIGEMKKMGGPTLQMRQQLDALAPSIKKLLPQELFDGKESTTTSSASESKAAGVEQPIEATGKAKAPASKSTAGKPTRFEGIKTTGLETEILKQFPGKEAAIETIQKGVADRFPKEQRQKVYVNMLKTFNASLEAGDDFALKRGIDAGNKKPGTTLGSGLGGVQQFLDNEQVKPYSPEEIHMISHSVADAQLSRWENMTMGELAKKKAGLWKDSLVNRINETYPTSTDPDTRLEQMERYNELVDRHNDLKAIVGRPSNMLDSISDMFLNRGAKLKAGQLLRETGGVMDRNNAILRQSFDGLQKFMDGLSLAESDRFWDNMTRGNAQIDDAFHAIDQKTIDEYQAKHGSIPDPNEVASRLRTSLDAARERVTATSGKLENFFTNYMPGLWENSAKGRSFTDNWVGNQNLQGDTHFLKQKMHEYYNDALAAGLQPTTTNPVRGAMMITEQLNRYTMAHDFKNRLLDEGLADHYQQNEAPPQGWEKLDDRLFTQGNGGYWAPSAVARTFNNFTSAGLKNSWKVPYTNLSLYDAMRSTNNLANQMQLGISIFHGMETTVNSAFTTMALGLKQVANEGKIIAGIGNMLKGGTFIAPIAEDVWNGSKGLINYRDPTKALNYAQLGSDLESARANVITDPTFKPEQIERFKKNYADAKDSLLPISNRASAVGKAALNALGTAVETTAWPIMNYLVPRVKIGAFYKMAQQIHSEFEGQPPEIINMELQKAWDSVDNRFGQVSYQNMFLNKTVQDIASLAVRSPGWNIGTLREVGGGAIDAVNSIAQAAQGKGFKITNRTAYTGALVMGTMMMNAVYQMLHPNAPPPKGIDYFFPQDGTKTVQGEANRVYPKDYIYDFINLYHDPLSTIGHKAAPDISTMVDLIKNQDYYHKVIRDPGDSVARQAASTIGYMAHQFVPFSFGNLAEARLRNQSGTIESFAGILPAPRWVGRTPAENLAYKYFEGTEGNGPQSAAKLEMNRNFIKLRNDVANGKVTDQQLEDAINQKKISPAAVKYLYQSKDTMKPQLQKWVERLQDPTYTWNVWKAASPEEKKVLLNTVYKNVATHDDAEQENKLEELQKFSDSIK